MKTKEIYTYYALPGCGVISGFIRSWARAGWNPVVLMEIELMSTLTQEEHEYIDAVLKLPSIHCKSMKLASYARWLAFRRALERADGRRGFFADFDVINAMGLRPDDPRLSDLSKHDGNVAFSHAGVGFWHMTYEGCNRIIDAFKTYKAAEGTKHTSDMLIIQELDLIYRPHVSLVQDYNYDTYPLMHINSDGLKTALF